MKVIFEFDTDSENFSPAELEMHFQAWHLVHCIDEIREKMRSWTKYDQTPIVNESTFFWEDLTEEKKQFYKEHKIPDVDKMTDEIYDIINQNVNMERLGY